MFKFPARLTSVILSILTSQLTFASGGLEPVDDVQSQSQKALPPETDDLGKVLGNGSIILGGQYVSPDFAHKVRNLYGNILNARQQQQLVDVCDDTKMPVFLRADYWPRAQFLLEAFNTPGLSQKPGFAAYVVRLTKAMMTFDLSREHHLAWLLDPSVLARCQNAKQVYGLIPQLTEKYFYAKRFKEDLEPSKTFRKEYQPKKEHYTKQRVHPFIYGWLGQADVLKLCHNQRDLKRLLKIVGTDYDMPLYPPASTIDPENRKLLNWINKGYWGEDNILGWLQHSGTLAACQNLDQLQQLFNLFAGMESRSRYLLFQWTEKTGVLRLCADAAQRIEFLTFFATKNTPEDQSAMQAMAFVGAVVSAKSTDEVIQIYNMLASYAPDFVKSGDNYNEKSRNGVHLRALINTSALDVCQSVGQVGELLSAVRKGRAVKLLKGPNRAQKFKEFGPMIDGISKINGSYQAAKNLKAFFGIYVTKEAHYIFADTMEQFRALDRGLLYDVIHLASLRSTKPKDCSCSDKDKYGPSEAHVQHDVAKIFAAFFEAATGRDYVLLPGVIDAVLSWTHSEALQNDFYGMTYYRPVIDVAAPVRQPTPVNVISEEMKYMSKLSADQRKFFLSLPYEAFDYRAHCYNCMHGLERIPHKGPEVMRLLARAVNMPTDLLHKAIAWSKENVFSSDDLRGGYHDREAIWPKLREIENLISGYCPWQQGDVLYPSGLFVTSDVAKYEAHYLRGIKEPITKVAPQDKGELNEKV